MTFDILNLVQSESFDSEGKIRREWHQVGNVSVAETPSVQLRTIQWPGGGIFGPGDRPSKTYRIVTIIAPPFVMNAEADDNKTCVKGLPCLNVNTTNKVRGYFFHDIRAKTTRAIATRAKIVRAKQIRAKLIAAKRIRTEYN